MYKDKPLDVFGLIANSILNYGIKHYGKYNDEIEFYNAWIRDEANYAGYPMGRIDTLEFALTQIKGTIGAPLHLLLLDQEAEAMFDSVLTGERRFRREKGCGITYAQ